MKPTKKSDGVKYNVNWVTKAKGLKNAEYTDREAAWKSWRFHSKQDSYLWIETTDGSQHHFRDKWLHEWGTMKTETEMKEDYYKFLERGVKG